ncbi:exonuclease SbcCD subunit D C-terminal domain-containing protein [Gramella sp. GC03-9]|uniref:Nuclease SbcCD subunit D n=1 Tax=Christiangramia oceanisediminis TaxID=2920386 RepID=A0A9X2KYU4_9FLAO|nr:exonuclease SbcCD subunit D C-terminal domain-containing protein [Gramella oceanisediminis]MCP9200868.1 exonuclease SbcCD subunit D C-terminal domain-containing protein [Gramella oceanisediminis]
MKILHTADWHIGKKLHKHELSEDFDLFINWLIDYISENKIEVLLISGDIFDLANPSSEARKQYYQALVKLQKLDCKIIATGGNHDSPAMLNAPADLMRALDMEVIGGLPEKLEETLIPVYNKNNELELVIAAIPYLRDSDLRTGERVSSYEERLEAIREGIQNIFHSAAEICKDKYPEVPVIAMGHLFTAGMESSESERDIQIGNLAAFRAAQFGDYFSYVALGHIHKPQKVNAGIPVYYSGSPFPLSFSERKDEKRVLLIDTDKSFEPESISLPNFRQLIRLSGNLEELQLKLNSLENHSKLTSLIEVDLEEDQYDAQKIYALDKMVNDFDREGFEIVKQRAQFRNRVQAASELYNNDEQLEDLKPKDVFLELIANHEYSEEEKNEILAAFNEILEEVESENTAE